MWSSLLNIKTRSYGYVSISDGRREHLKFGQGCFSLKKTRAFSKNRVLRCSMQNFGGTYPKWLPSIPTYMPFLRFSNVSLFKSLWLRRKVTLWSRPIRLIWTRHETEFGETLGQTSNIIGIDKKTSIYSHKCASQQQQLFLELLARKIRSQKKLAFVREEIVLMKLIQNSQMIYHSH